ncbi:MAG: cupin domain-containing protein [Flavobacteriaceae bacterium]|nr:cupin domain-containing protein [Muriicola sp.]NNC61771.1 cupin domain-containing protein [Eudoraea sp.]NNK21293.1 cupin domain-containing protein [Flavobacteriaceae bacterium]MBT8290771.1 cupin domain-containing protein [Muriicola sp.]NNK35970.1 cupin domain-containing protein [Eudoraea sp.]
MNQPNFIWVLGHQIQPQQITGDYDLVNGETPPKTEGPPPHMHKGFHEVFIVTEGEMSFLIDGQPRTAKKGDVINLQPETVHTFSNETDQPCKWINIHSPKGFLAFFKEFGVTSDIEDARQRSVAPSIIGDVIRKAADHDMHIV